MEDIAQERGPGYRYSRRATLPLIRQLSVVPNWRNALLLALQWAVMIAACVIAIRVDRWPAYLIAGIVIGTRIQVLAVMMHEACHGMLFSNRRINDLIGDLFVAYPFALSVDLYRAARKDSDQDFPKDGRAMAVLLLRSLTGVNYYRVARPARVWSPLANFHNPMRFGFDFRLALRVRYVVWVLLVYGVILWSPWRWQILGLFLVPQFLWMNVFNRIRAMAEHNGVTDESEIRGTRTVIPTLIDRILIGPLNVSYHLEHHLFPSVPWHNLRRLHRHLMASDPLYARDAHVTRGYWAMIRELMPPPGDRNRRAVPGEANP
ncbi:fatty acid desaturase [Sphingobium sp. IP1]|uniref:fatty acid desaturase family protein n=1 Tax=Sphingobium sp. IP1 TaxID=2021637 RepID=UPI000C06BF85|nr:fatty acid desaturase family protein [Sphingobium sp. IP1]PHP20004.1 fatty acid desaturase [Sphingobium sp. IP1]